MAERKDWDGGIELILGEIARRPGEVALHEELRRIALGRKIAGGKPMSMVEDVAERNWEQGRGELRGRLLTKGLKMYAIRMVISEAEEVNARVNR